MAKRLPTSLFLLGAVFLFLSVYIFLMMNLESNVRQLSHYVEAQSFEQPSAIQRHTEVTRGIFTDREEDEKEVQVVPPSKREPVEPTKAAQPPRPLRPRNSANDPVMKAMQLGAYKDSFEDLDRLERLSHYPKDPSDSPSYTYVGGSCPEIPNYAVIKPKCSKGSKHFLNRIAKKLEAVDKPDVPNENLALEPDMVCRPLHKYERVDWPPFNDYCQVVQQDPLQINQMVVFSREPADRLLGGFIRMGWTSPSLPEGKINDLPDDCHEIIKEEPRLYHHFYKSDFRTWKAGIYLGGASKMFECFTWIKEVFDCKVPQQWSLMRESAHQIVRKDFLPMTVKKYQKKVGDKCLRYNDILPQTYVLNLPDQCVEFFEYINDNMVPSELQKWMVKSPSVHRGAGVNVLHAGNFNELLGKFKRGASCYRSWPQTAPLVQEFVKDAHLINGRKFHLRVYMLFASTRPKLAYFIPVFLVRRAFQDFDPDSTDKSAALTNRHLAERLGFEDDSLLTPEMLGNYLYQAGEIADPKWIDTILRPNLRTAIAHLVNAIELTDRDQSRFDFLGLDILLRKDFRVTIMEVNYRPAAHEKPIKKKKLIFDNMAKIMTQIIVDGKRTIADIDAGFFEPIYDETLKGPERFFGNLNDACYFE